MPWVGSTVAAYPSECDAMGRTLLLLSTILNMMPQLGAIVAATHLYTMSYVGSIVAVYTSECAAMGRLCWLSACAVLLYSLDFLFLSRMVSGEESEIRLYQFLIIAFSST